MTRVDIELNNFKKRYGLIKEFENEFKKLNYADTPTVDDFLQYLDANGYFISYELKEEN